MTMLKFTQDIDRQQRTPWICSSSHAVKYPTCIFASYIQVNACALHKNVESVTCGYCSDLELPHHIPITDIISSYVL